MSNELLPFSPLTCVPPLTSLSKTYKLNTGDLIPAVGLGTWRSGPNEVATAVEVALKAGYRHIDTAQGYGNEKEVGDGIRASGVPRDQIWLTDRKSTRLNSSHSDRSRMPSSA